MSIGSHKKVNYLNLRRLATGQRGNVANKVGLEDRNRRRLSRVNYLNYGKDVFEFILTREESLSLHIIEYSQ